eukprot:6815572-Prymnesium_polylepis.1
MQKSELRAFIMRAEAVHLTARYCIICWNLLILPDTQEGAVLALAAAEGVLWHRLVVEDCRETPRPEVAHALLRVERV